MPQRVQKLSIIIKDLVVNVRTKQSVIGQKNGPKRDCFVFDSQVIHRIGEIVENLDMKMRKDIM